MSSNYIVLCLSHDPATIALDRDYRTREQAEEAVRAGVDEHHGCDLLIGRFSYPLVEVGCPGSRGSQARKRGGCRLSHLDAEWVDSGWLRVLAHARAAGALPPEVAQHSDLSCWTEERVWRLRNELGLELPPTRADESSSTPVDIVHSQAEPQVDGARGVDESSAQDLSTPAAVPSWRQDPDGTWSVPIGEGLLTVPAHASVARRDQLLLTFLFSPAAGHGYLTPDQLRAELMGRGEA